MKSYGNSILRRWIGYGCLYVLCVQVVAARDIVVRVIVEPYSAPCGGNFGTVKINAVNGAVAMIANGTLNPSPPGSENVFDYPLAFGSVAGYPHVSFPASGTCPASSATGQYIPSNAEDPTGSGPYIVRINLGEGLDQNGNPPTNYWFKMCYHNSASYTADFDIVDGVVTVARVVVPTGQTVCTVLGPYDEQKTFVAVSNNGQPITDDGQLAGSLPPDCSACGVSWHTSNPGTAPAGTPGNGGQPPAVTPTNNTPNINFSGDDGDAKDSTLREGFTVLREALVNGFAIQHQGLQDVVVAADGVKSSVNTVNTSVQSVKTSVDAVNSSVGQAVTQLGLIKASTDANGAKLNTIDTSLNNIEDDTEQIKVDTAAQGAGIAVISNQTIRAATGIEGVSNQLATLNGTATSMNSKLGNIESDADASRIAEQASQVELINIKTEAQGINAKLVQMQIDTSYVRGNTEGINTKAQGIYERLGEANVHHIYGNQRLDTANTHLASIASSVGSQNQYLDGLESGLSSINSSLQSVNTSVQALGPKIDDVKDAIGEGSEDFRSWTNMFHETTANEVEANLAAQDAAGRSALSGSDGLFEGLSAGIVSAPPTAVGGSSVFQVSVAGFSFNLDPITNPRTSALCSAIKECLRWLIQMFFVWGCWKYLDSHLTALPSAQQVRAPNISVFGNNFGVALGVPIATAITVLFAAIPAFAIAFVTSESTGFFGVNPFNSFGAVSGSLYLANGILPLDVIVADIFLFAGYVVTLTHLHWFATGLVRFLIG